MRPGFPTGERPLGAGGGLFFPGEAGRLGEVGGLVEEEDLAEEGGGVFLPGEAGGLGKLEALREKKAGSSYQEKREVLGIRGF